MEFYGYSDYLKVYITINYKQSLDGRRRLLRMKPIR